MKIFLAFLQAKRQHPIPACDFWSYYIKNGIEEAGHLWIECPEVDWAYGLVPKTREQQQKWEDEAWTKTLKSLKQNPPDIFLSYLYPQQIVPTAVAEIKQMGIPCVNFFCDHVREFNKVPKEFSVFDLTWVPEHKATIWYKKAGYPYLNLPMPMWVEPERRRPKEETNNRVTFIGSKDVQRAILFDEIINKDPQFPLTVYGNGWQKTKAMQETIPEISLSTKITFNLNILKKQGLVPYLRKLRQRGMEHRTHEGLDANVPPSFEKYNELITGSMIALGVNRYPSYRFPLYRPDTYSRLRDIEAPMLGACYLTEWAEGIENLYEVGNEIFVYHSVDELMNQASLLSNAPGKRRELRLKGQMRALRDHNIPNSINRVISSLNV